MLSSTLPAHTHTYPSHTSHSPQQPHLSKIIRPHSGRIKAVLFHIRGEVDARLIAHVLPHIRRLVVNIRQGGEFSAGTTAITRQGREARAGITATTTRQGRVASPGGLDVTTGGRLGVGACAVSARAPCVCVCVCVCVWMCVCVCVLEGRGS